MNIFRAGLNRKIAVVLASLVILGGLFGVYFIFSADGAPVEVLGGNGSLDTTTQVNTFTLVNTTGTSTWALDTGNKFAGAGSGRLRSPQGNGVNFNGYVYYRFTTTKVPESATLDLAYKKTWTGAQPSAGNWNATAEIWEVGGAAPLQTITIDNGTANVNFVAKPTQNITAITKMNTQYELRLKQQGRTGASSTGQLTTWFDEVKLTVTYDELAPAPVSAAAVTDTSVDVVFSEQVEKVSAETLANYSITPALAISGAVLQADGITVRLTTAKQVKGTQYTITVNGVKDISGNVMTTAKTVLFTGIDSTPPVVSSATSVNNTTVNVVFNEEVDWATAQNTANYSFNPAISVTNATLQADNKTVQLITSPQTGGTNYTVTVTGVQDTAGNVIAGNNTAAFAGTAPPDATPPTVVSATGVNNTTIDVVFSEKVDTVTARNTANYAVNPALAVSAAALQADDKTVRLTTSSQTGGTPYTVTVTNVKDISGNTIGAGNSAGFTGIAPPDTTPPTVASARSVNNTTAEVVFSEPLDVDTAQNAANYAVTPALAVTRAAIQADGRTVRLTTAGQAGGTGYTVTVTNVKDVAGNPVGAPNTASFTGTAPDTTPPAVVSATAISATRVDVVFSEEVEPLNAQKAANFTTNPLLTVSAAALQPDGKTVRLTTALQAVGTTYSLTVANIRDLAGNLIGVGNSTTFTGSNIAIQSPHGSYLDDTNQCVKCHTTHNGKGVSLITEQTVTNLCYLCHDAAGQSKFDVATQFGKTAPFAASRHPVPDGGQQCTDCHNPHDGGKDGLGNNIHWPRLLQNKVDKNIHSGNQFCLNCHQTAQGSTTPVNAATFPADGTAHNNSSYTINGVQPFNPASGTNIRCMGCHENHGSGAGPLLRANPNQDGSKAGGNDKTFCYECHSGGSADNRYKGKDVFDSVYGKHSQQASNKTNVNFPGRTGQAGQCANCHEPHGTANGTSKVAMKTMRGVYNDGKTNYTAADFDLCFQCHNSTSKDKAYDVQTDYNNIKGGHRIKTAGGNLAVGSKLPCEACHDIHGSANGNKYGLKDALGSSLGDGRSECLACHRTGATVEGLTMSAPPTDIDEHLGGTTRCLDCHGKPHKVNNGLSEGGVDCLSCHKQIATAMKSTNGYHHLITSTAPEYTPASGKTCLTCHVDHNKFNNQKAFNLKANYMESFLIDDATPGQNTDFIAADSVNGGLCLSCHKTPQLKTYTQADGTTATPPISISGYANSAHNYVAQSIFGDATIFQANCAKCHNDSMTKTKQTSINKFGTHDSGYQRILTPFGDVTLTDPLKQKLCFKCHTVTGDPYGTVMGVAAKDIEAQFAKTSTHNLTGANGSQLACVNCHGPHSVSKNPFSAGLSNSDISDPDNTLNPFTTANGDMTAFCLKCHDGSPPAAINNGTSFVPYSVVFSNKNFTNNGGGWNKSAFGGALHHGGASLQCTDCHQKHGSQYPNLLKYAEDTDTINGNCLRCHGGAAGSPANAPNVKPDLTRTGNPSPDRYRHPTLFKSGLHSNTENYANKPLTERHAECTDCHDPHAEDNTPANAPYAPGALKNVSGVGLTYGATPWTAPTYTFKTSITYQYELCIKCHSSYSWGTTPPTPAGSITQTDTAVEFNPNNPSYHAVVGPSKTNYGKYATDSAGRAWTKTDRLYCEDCHRSGASNVSGPHGSNYWYILKAPWTRSNGAEGIGGTGGANTQSHLCFQCHDYNFYASGADRGSTTNRSAFSGGGDYNLHAKHDGRGCTSCHSAVPHGWKKRSMLTETNDSAPYRDGSWLEITTWQAQGSWTQNSCNHGALRYGPNAGQSCG